MRAFALSMILIPVLLSCGEEGTAKEGESSSATEQSQQAEKKEEYKSTEAKLPTCAKVGCMAPEIVMQGRDGEERKLSDLKGKVVLIDFWASWCGPCRRENPNLVATYNMYKDKGFDVFSVSLDNDAYRWKEAIIKDNLTWENHVCDYKKWDTPMVQLYGFQGIPHTVLLDQNGKIVATGLRGAELEKKVGELLN